MTEEIIDNKHTFYFINPLSRINFNPDILESLKILWEFENKTDMTQSEIDKYISNMTNISINFKTKCNIFKKDAILNEFHKKVQKSTKIPIKKTIKKSL